VTDLSVLAAEMLEWERKRQELDELERRIKDAVMVLGKTQTVGNVRATYSKGRRSFDYQAAADGNLFTEIKTVVSTDWKGICEHVGIDDVPFTQGNPSVSLKLLG